MSANLNKNMETKKILIACSGSVATIKLNELIHQFRDSNFCRFKYEIKVICTQNSLHFFDRNELPVDVPVLTDADEWNLWQKRDDPVLHIDLGKWADVMVIAPLDANTLAKMAGGICDNLLLCTTRAWNFDKPLFFCPAMNTRMWEHPITSQHINVLKSWGHIEIECIAKKLMCGDTGLGAMETPANIFQRVNAFLEERSASIAT